jgi:putative ABC transport system ATP-binding protein
MAAIVSVERAVKEYPLGKTLVRALKGVDLTIERGEFTVIAGPSGSGKTTLLNLIGCVDVPTSGTVTVDGKATGKLSDRELTRLRLHSIGFIFQSFNLVNVLDVFQNVELPLLLQGTLSADERRQRVTALVERVGIKEYLHHRPNELSGGQRQRVAIARSLVTKPALVLADEPTANLDSVTGGSILDQMRELNDGGVTTFLFSTHDPAVMKRARRIVHMLDGNLDTSGAHGATSAV